MTKSRDFITRLLMIGLVAWIEYHLVVLWRYGAVTIYETERWILAVELVLVTLLLVLRVESYVRMIIGALRAKSDGGLR